MLIGTLPEKEFFGRAAELADLRKRAHDAEQGRGQAVFLTGPRGIGKTELLKQFLGALFWRQERVAPFFYTPNAAALSAADFAQDYLFRYLCHRLAFEKKDSSLVQIEVPSLGRLYAIAEERRAAWALALLDRFIQARHEPLAALRVAVSAPHESILSTGVPVAVLFDEFQRLQDLQDAGGATFPLAGLFEPALSFGKMLWVITGSEAQIREMPLAGRLTPMALAPLGSDDASALFCGALRSVRGAAPEQAPPGMARLGGNPAYIRSMARALAGCEHIDNEAFREAYGREIAEGSISLAWSAVLKGAVPEPGLRRYALEIVQRLSPADEPLTLQRIAAAFPTLGEHAGAVLDALSRAGIVRGEFGLYRAAEDRVLRDVIDALYHREILGRPAQDLAQAPVEGGRGATFELTLPMVKDVELVAAQCLEQIGKSLGTNPEAIGQLQVAVIEACLNAVEHSGAEDRKIALTIDVGAEQIVVGVESAGREFISPETGKPFAAPGLREGPARGRGMDLMKSFADDVRFERTPRGTRVVLTKHLPQGAPVPGEQADAHE